MWPLRTREDRALEHIVEMTELAKWYGEVIGLNNITASIPAGITGLLGHNGAGKTTLLSLITGQLRPSMGEIAVLGERPWSNAVLLSRIGCCPESDGFWRGLTGSEFVTFLARANGMTPLCARRAAEKAIDVLGMAGDKDRKIAEYSRGMRQRIKIAQALVHSPELLVLDEPLSGMDPVGRAELISLFKRLARAGTSVLVSSHVLHEVEAMTNNILLIDHGQLVAQGDVHEIRDLMEEQSHHVLIRTRESRKLATLLAPKDYVSALEVCDGETVMVSTRDPNRFFGELTAILLDNGIACSEITSPDEGLEAVFGYLTGRRR